MARTSFPLILLVKDPTISLPGPIAMYAKIKNQQVIQFPYSLGSFRAENPGTSFPASIPDSTLAEFGVYPVASTPAPTFNPQTHRLVSHPELLGNVWTQVWQAEQLSVEKATNNIRAQRNQLLADCDWTQLPDAPVDAAAWATYRQALRDISSQPDFPWNVTWPTEP